MSLRILAGDARGMALELPAAELVRPTSSRRREAVFDILGSHLGDLSGTKVVDLFAGSGAVGLEACSRGAAEVVLVENQPAVLAVLRRNIQKLDRKGRVKLMTSDATRLGRSPGNPADVLFLDPPYANDLMVPALTAAANGAWLDADTVILAEVGKRQEPELPSGFRVLRAYPHGAGRLLRLQWEMSAGADVG